MPADCVAPVVLWFVGLRTAPVDGELSCAPVVRLIPARIVVNVVQLKRETAFLTRAHFRQFQGHGYGQLLFVVSLARNVIATTGSIRRLHFEPEKPSGALRRVGHLD